jgi:hypothetical protein
MNVKEAEAAAEDSGRWWQQSITKWTIPASAQFLQEEEEESTSEGSDEEPVSTSIQVSNCTEFTQSAAHGLLNSISAHLNASERKKRSLHQMKSPTAV